jgi:hypothetical protein
MVMPWILSAAASADTFLQCVERVYVEDVTAKQAWHRTLRDLTAKGRPELAAVAALDMNQQLALIDRRQAQFNHVIQVDPKRIRTHEGLSPFRNFGWSEADALALRQRSPSYVALERRVANLARQAKGHPDWPTLQGYSREVLGVSPQFQDALQRLQARESDVDRLLKRCPSPPEIGS